VFFPSNFFHEVRPVRRETEAFADSRFSVNVWFWVGRAPRWGSAEHADRPVD
jgi:Rps23 Pro-64 3,4-dihydroxylase Tpa1-like proline 4-hydroxylase